MIRYKEIPENIQELLPKAVEYLQTQQSVCFAYLFGGLARGRQTPLSDVDIAVYFSEDVDIKNTKIKLLEQLTEILRTDEIDLVALNKAPLSLKMNILKNNKLLVDKYPKKRHIHQSLTMRKYFDYHRLESQILKMRFYNGR
jgi:uncharacterized protein